MLFTSPVKSVLFVINFSLRLPIEWRCAAQDNWKNPHQTKSLVSHYFYHAVWLSKRKRKSNSPPSSFHNTTSICLTVLKTILVCCKFRLKCSQLGAVVHVLSYVYRKNGVPFVKILYLTDLAQKVPSLRIYGYLYTDLIISGRDIYLCMQR